MWPGILCSLVLAGVALFAAQSAWLQGSGLSPLVLAFLLGALLRIGWTHTRLQTGLGWAQTRLLRGGVMLLGLQVTGAQILALGTPVMLLDLAMVTSVLASGYWLGTRLFKLPSPLVILTCAGSAICGAAAVAATNSVLRAEDKDTAVAISTVVLFGTLAMLIYPLWFPHAALAPEHFGIYIGATVHEVAQVVAAGASVGNGAMETAVVVKLVRVLALLPWLFVLGMLQRRQAATGVEAARSPVPLPWFVLGFLALVTLNSLVALPQQLHQGLLQLGNLAMTAAMAAIGLQFDLRGLRRVGWRPFALGALLFTWLSVGGYGLVRWLV